MCQLRLHASMQQWQVGRMNRRMEASTNVLVIYPTTQRKVRLKVQKVFGNDLDRGCCFGEQHAVRLCELTTDTVL
jgi:hypothetical protein